MYEYVRLGRVGIRWMSTVKAQAMKKKKKKKKRRGGALVGKIRRNGRRPLLRAFIDYPSPSHLTSAVQVLVSTSASGGDLITRDDTTHLLTA